MDKKSLCIRLHQGALLTCIHRNCQPVNYTPCRGPGYHILLFCTNKRGWVARLHNSEAIMARSSTKFASLVNFASTCLPIFTAEDDGNDAAYVGIHHPVRQDFPKWTLFFYHSNDLTGKFLSIIYTNHTCIYTSFSKQHFPRNFIAIFHMC